jgi:hypothetical protein
VLSRLDAYIYAPPAIQFIGGGPAAEVIPPGVSDQDIIQMQQTEIRMLRGEITKLQATANTIANAAACLAYLAQPQDGGKVVVPREVRDRLKADIKLSVRSTEEGTELGWTTRPGDHVFEGRADG